MKAIRKSDGKIIDVEVHGWRGDCAMSYHTNFKDFYKPEDLDFNIPQVTEQSSSFDWQSFRAEAAKDILCSVILTFEAKESFDKSLDNAINNSIKATDKLISKLKEKEEK